jgi:hypothetical protein
MSHERTGRVDRQVVIKNTVSGQDSVCEGAGMAASSAWSCQLHGRRDKDVVYDEWGWGVGG